MTDTGLRTSTQTPVPHPSPTPPLQIGLLLHLPEGGRPLEVLERSVVRWKGALYYKDEGDPQPQPLKVRRA